MSQSLSNKEPIHLMVGTDESGEIWVYTLKDVHQVREFREAVADSKLDMHFIYAPIYGEPVTAAQAIADLREMKGIEQ